VRGIGAGSTGLATGFASIVRGIGAGSTGLAATGFGSVGRATGALVGLLSTGRGTAGGRAMLGKRLAAGTGPHAFVAVGGVGGVRGKGGYEMGRGGTEGAALETGLAATEEAGFASVALGAGLGGALGVETGAGGGGAFATFGASITVVGSSSQPSSTVASSDSGFDSDTVSAEILLKDYP
jgi:hypothetical protein